MANKKQSKEKAEKPKVKWYKRSMPKTERVFEVFVFLSGVYVLYLVIAGYDDPTRFILSAPLIAFVALIPFRHAMRD